MATDPMSILGAQGGLPQLPPELSQMMAPPAAPASPMLPAQAAPSIPQELAPPEKPLIEKLAPGSELHNKTLQKLNAMFKFSRDEMKKHYTRWNFGEQRIQAYCATQDYDRLIDSLAHKGARLPEPIQVIVPYSYATLHAAATFMSNVLLSRKPMFPLLGVRGTMADNARYMEQAIQANLDASRGQEELWQHIWDSLIYSFSVIKIDWLEKKGKTIRWVGGERTQVEETIFAGNKIKAIDPYASFPDPRVPLSECNTRGDFMFILTTQSETVLLDMEARGELKHVKKLLSSSSARSELDEQTPQEESRRRLKIGISGERLITPANVVGFRQLREGTVRLSPKAWGFSDQDASELYKFTWSKGQIIQAEPLGMLHEQHPFVCAEPASLGHDFMSVAMSDMIGPFQDILSWLVSSRMENVRTAINNQFVVDPARVEVNDIRSSAIGRVIRLKQAAMGLPVQQAIMQLSTVDVTGGHLTDIQTMRVLADTITGVNDNLRGIQTAGGRRSATEARMSMQAGAGRLSQMAIRISAQSMQPMAQQMIMNIQQFMPMGMWIETTGDDGQLNSWQAAEGMLQGSFNYQISDGSLPFDKTALVEIWKEILFGIAKDPELRQQYDLGKIFNYTAELGGAKNIDSFKRPPQQMQLGAANNPGAQPGMTAVGAAMPEMPMASAVMGV